MKASGHSGPVVVCLELGHDPPPLVQYGMALAHLWDASLYLITVVVLPPQRTLDLSESEEQAVQTLLDTAADLAAGSEITLADEICVARSWQEAFQQMAVELSASALVIGWRTSGPLHLFDIGRTLLKAVPCPVIMVGQSTDREAKPSWPASGGLVEA